MLAASTPATRKHDPDAERIEAVGTNYDTVQEIISESTSDEFGGIQTKVEGARDVSEHGIPAVIAKSTEPDIPHKDRYRQARGPYSSPSTVCVMTETDIERDVDEAQTAALELAKLSDAEQAGALHEIADAIEARTDESSRKTRDVNEGERLLEEGEYTQALVDRLKLSESKIESIAEMVRSVAGQDDPLGKTLSARELDETSELYKIAVPIGVVGTVFESRPTRSSRSPRSRSDRGTRSF